MLSLARFGYRFTFRWQWFLLSLVGFSILSSLGLWQLNRASEKQTMLASFNQRQNQPPIPLTSFWTPTQTESKIIRTPTQNFRKMPAQYQAVSVQGKYLNQQQFLLDNQHHKHQFGYHLLTPLLLKSGQVAVIDRGWIKADITHRTLPDINALPDIQQLSGHVYYPSKGGLLLGEVENNPGLWPRVIERIDLTLISDILHRPVLRFIIRQQSEQNDGYHRQWAIVSMPPERHKAYALQWFSMALIALILFIALNMERK